MLEDLVETLDRAWVALDAERGLDFTLSCFRFHSQLELDPRTAAILADLRREEADSQAGLYEAHVKASGELLTILDELELAASTHFSSPPKDSWDYDSSPSAIRYRINKSTVWAPPPYMKGKEGPSDNVLADAISLLKEVAAKAKHEEMTSRLRAAERKLVYSHRIRRIFYMTSAAASLVVLERKLADMHPPATDPGLEEDLARLVRLRQEDFGTIADALFGNGTVSQLDPKAENFVVRMRSDVRRIYEDVRRRIGTERSLLAVFQRYRQRCQWYDADRMRAMVLDRKGKAEEFLVETLASYLFDHGFNPLTQPIVGKIRPDLLDAHARFSFYVEAKQYETAKRKYLLDGMQQVWDMLSQLKGSGFDVKEAFYVVYRIGGPRYDFYPRVQHGDRVVHVLMIDLAPTDERGSNAPATTSFSAADLAPKPVSSK